MRTSHGQADAISQALASMDLVASVGPSSPEGAGLDVFKQGETWYTHINVIDINIWFI
jgi:hypothetical protein